MHPKMSMFTGKKSTIKSRINKVNKIADWLREASDNEPLDKILVRCQVAAGEIERLEHARNRAINERDAVQKEFDKFRQSMRVSSWKKWFNIPTLNT
jgi:hypothetical protein